MKTSFQHQRDGLSLIDVIIIFATLVFMVTFLLIFNPFQRASSKAQRITCVNNLKQVGLSFRIWSGDHGDVYPMQLSTNAAGSKEWIEGPYAFRHFQLLSNELGTPKVIVCPTDMKRTAAMDFVSLSNASVGYFLGVDAVETNANGLLAGDRNIENGSKPSRNMLGLTTNQNVRFTKELHNQKGNICLSDGSVQQVSNAQLRAAIIAKTGLATNRILLP